MPKNAARTEQKRGGGYQKGGYQQAQQIQEADQWGWAWPGAPAISRARKQTGGRCKVQRGGTDPSAGWRDRAPPRGTARHALMSKCGSKCFLMPDKEGFPVCARSLTCEFDCGGVLAAYRRARQYKYEHVADSARRLALQHQCSWLHQWEG
jgi:hypothetical protein